MVTIRKRIKRSRRTAHKWSAKYKKSINCRRPRGFSQRQYCKYGRRKQSSRNQQRRQQQQQQQQHFNQSGGDILNYLPSDASMSLRSVGHALSSFVSGVKGVQPSPNPLPYNDQKLQKTEVKVSERIPDIKAHYQNAMNLIPSL